MRARLAAIGRWLARHAGWITLALAAAVLLLGCVLVFPRLLYPPLSERALDQAQVSGKDRIQLQSERLKLQNDARTTLLQGLGGAVVLLGAWFTYRQLHTLREGQITERFTRAVDQLGSDRLDVSLGGIYALERIARDSQDDRRTIAEILTAHIRQRSPWPPSQPGQYRADWPLDQQPDLRTRAPDVQAALIVLGRGPFPRPLDTPEVPRLDLVSADLRKAILRDAYLEGADLAGAHLEGADLGGARLAEAILRDAHLAGAILRFAYLDWADLRHARLEGAYLGHASLNRAYLGHARLNRAYLGHARLNRACLGDARLARADLGDARLARADLGDAHLEGADLGDAWLEGADLGDAHLEGADFRGAHLEGADLRGAWLEGAILRGASLEGADLREANLEGAYLDPAHADLAGARLEWADRWPVRLKGAKANEATRWPDGFDPKHAGVVLVDERGQPVAEVGRDTAEEGDE
jgi:uncharacterized protein YjbI with pentapeptide repeats